MDAFFYDKGFSLNDIIKKWAPKRIEPDNGYKLHDDVYAKFTDRWGPDR